jgi:putative membrane protein insertion efficiency factor
MKVIIISILLFATISNSFAEDSTTELDFILLHNPIISQQIVNKQNTNANFFRPSAVFIGMIRFYQLFLSTQDMPVCNFTPSCSQFGTNSLREFGVLRGILLTSDRLQRCNGFSAPYYQLDYLSGKYIDPVQIYSYLLKLK